MKLNAGWGRADGFFAEGKDFSRNLPAVDVGFRSSGVAQMWLKNGVLRPKVRPCHERHQPTSRESTGDPNRPPHVTIDCAFQAMGL